MKAIDKAKSFLKKYRHAWVLSYFLIYMPWFVYLEKRTDVRHYMIHSPIDNHIPFIEYFIIPYLLWFIFIAVTVAYFLIKDKWGFYRLCAFLFSGMTIFLIICTVFPNALNLRPTVFPRDNMFTDMVKVLYKTDTPTNVLPSIHVFNSIGAGIAISHSNDPVSYTHLDVYKRQECSCVTVYNRHLSVPLFFNINFDQCRDVHRSCKDCCM